MKEKKYATGNQPSGRVPTAAPVQADPFYTYTGQDRTEGGREGSHPVKEEDAQLLT